MRKQPGVLLPLVVGIVALLGFGALWLVLEPDMGSPASTLVWLLSELVFALALAVPAVCLFFVIRAMHIRRVQAREATGPDAVGVARARDLLWSLSHGLLPQTESAGSLPTDATEPVFLAGRFLAARHALPAPSLRRMRANARDLERSGRGWTALTPVEIAATDRRILLRSNDVLWDIRYSDIAEVHVEVGRVILCLQGQEPVLVEGDVAESLAVLAVWGSVGESALRRHPALASLRT
ncbi:hypothetical protein IWX78_000689 [Mycetocola sp. CAN_C7]|uniref:hypothetical protein n=1 Tax=Mycetocola sp. CAN_C7 TaxID=2787724 RepID=UPI0018CA3A1C